MTRKEAQVERDRKAEDHPDSTWLIAERKPGNWSVVEVGLEPTDAPTGESVQARSKPPYPDDPRSAQSRNFSQWGA